MSMDPKTMRTWTVHSHRCEACAVLEATVSNDHEAGYKHGMKYAVSRTTSGG